MCVCVCVWGEEKERERERVSERERERGGWRELREPVHNHDVGRSLAIRHVILKSLSSGAGLRRMDTSL